MLVFASASSLMWTSSDDSMVGRAKRRKLRTSRAEREEASGVEGGVGMRERLRRIFEVKSGLTDMEERRETASWRGGREGRRMSLSRYPRQAPTHPLVGD
jgi:hypothetical protein